MPLQDNNLIVDQYILDRMLNYNNSAEGGKVVPPRQKGSFRVPVVRQFAVIKTDTQSAGVNFTLSWNEPSDDPSQPIDHYNIYAKTTTLVSQSSSPHSPASVFVPADGTITPAVFTIQTVLANGTTSSVSVSPSATGRRG